MKSLPPVLLALLLAVPAFSADGDIVSSKTQGRMKEVQFRLCDGDHSATDCAELDTIEDLPDGPPDWIVYSLVSTTGCSGAPSVSVRGLASAAGVPFVYASLTTAGTSAVKVCGPRHRFHDATVSGATDCTDLEIRGAAFYSLRGGRIPCD